MTSADGPYTIRQYAQDLIRTLDEYEGNILLARDRCLPYLERFHARLDLLQIGEKGVGNHSPEVWKYYYDGELFIGGGREPLGADVPIHDHGVWQLLSLYRGRLKYTLYERLDDLSRPGYAKLRAVEERVMRPGDITVTPPPPNDIHSFTALTEDTILIGFQGGHGKGVRRYFDPARRTYVERDQKAWREAHEAKTGSRL